MNLSTLAVLASIVLAGCAGIQAPQENEPGEPAPRDNAMFVVMLGTGTPNADPDRSGPAVAVVRGEHAYLVDAGPGVVRRASAASQQHNIEALKAENLGAVFLTHLHSDHTLGLPDLMLSPWVLGRTEPLRIYGPPGTEHMADLITQAYDQDIRMRLDGLEPANDTGWRARVTEIAQAGVVYEAEGVRIEAFPVLHGSWEHAYGYKFSDGERTIVVSGDARPSPALIEATRGADVLVHEVYSTHGFATRPPEWQTYHASFHTSTQQLAEIANETHPGLLVLYHQLFWGVTDAQLVAELREFGYDGPVMSAQDLSMY